MKNCIEYIKSNAITRLDLTINNIGAEGVKALAEALTNNTSITHLNLTHNRIGDEGAKTLAEALQHNSNITSLILGINNIGVEGAKVLAKMLKTNTTITQLDLWGNHIGAEGGKALAEMLKTNTSITSLALEHSHIGDEGAKALAEMLKTNTRIIHLDLRNNNIGAEGVKALAEALKYNTSIIQLDLVFNNIGEEGIQAWNNIKAIILKKKTSFENKCKAVMDGEYKKFSLKDIQTFIPILNAKISDSDAKEQEKYMDIKDKLMEHFIRHLFPRLVFYHEEYPLPLEIMAHVSSFMLPSDIDLSTPAVITNNTTQPSRSFIEESKRSFDEMTNTNSRA